MFPRSLATAEGNVSELATGVDGTGAETVMFQFAASELAVQGLTIGDANVGVRVDLDGSVPAGPTNAVSWPDFTIKLAQATNSIG